MADKVVFRVETDLKDKSNDILESIGLDLSTYLRMSMKSLVNTEGIPFSVQLAKPNQETIKAIEESRAGETEQVTSEEWNNLLHENVKE